MRITLKSWKVLFVCAPALVAFWPVESLSAPDWTVCVVNESGTPAVGVLVRESYENYSAEWGDHEEDQYSDARGCVRFARKTIIAPQVIRLAAILTSALGLAHASFGPHSYVTAFSEDFRADDERNGRIYDWNGSPSEVSSKIVLRP